jgi:hypothetical protein
VENVQTYEGCLLTVISCRGIVVEDDVLLIESRAKV